MLYLVLIGILITTILAAGCTEEGAPPPESPPPADFIQPGQVLALVGFVTGDGLAHGTIDTIMFTVGLAPGEKAVDMEKISIIYADTIKTETLLPVAGFRDEPAQGEWSIMNVEDQVGDDNNRLEDKELFTIKINPRAYLPANRMIIIVVRTPTGTSLTIRRFAPPDILATGNILTPP
jgi:flagellin FlaB